MSEDAQVMLGWTGMTHRGKVRPNNEDTFLALTFDGHGIRYLGKSGEAPVVGADFVFAVSDGMGGAQSGEFASRIAVDRITKLLPRSFRLSAAGMANDFGDILSELFSAIHQDLAALGNAYPECAGMGATLTLTWFTPKWVYFAHLGDTRLYYLPAAGGFRQLTEDHTHVGWLRRQGRINEREARSHPMKSSLQKAVGAGHQFVDPQIGAVGYGPGDRFLLCSDGVVDGLWDRQLAEMLEAKEPPTAAQIVELAVENSGRDNATAIVIAASPRPAPPALLFVYGTLKRGAVNWKQMAGQRFVAEARTVPGFRLFDLGAYPGMVAWSDDREGVSGEVWEVGQQGLEQLDLFEGVPEGLFRREKIRLAGDFSSAEVQAYIYCGSIAGRREIGSAW